MADEHLFSADVESPGLPVECKSRWQSCLTGCLIVFVVLVAIAILIGFWISRNWRGLASSLGTAVIQQGVEASQLPVEEKQQIMVQVERVAKAFRENAITQKQLETLGHKLVESPLMSLMVASTIDQQYFAKSGLSDNEKAEGRQTVQRFFRGAIDDKINEAGIDAAMAHVADRDAHGQWKLRQTLTDDQLQAFLAEAKKQADAAGIPEQPAEIDPSEEIKKIVDEALAPTG